VISRKTLEQFWLRYPDLRRPLQLWFKAALNADWKNISDVRRIYPHADAVNVRSSVLTVFNICGNKYRLIVRIRYDWKLINVRHVLTHVQYDRGKWKE
jgi:mRNA interferase HigB